MNNGWQWESYLAKVEKEDIKEKIKESTFIAVSLDEFTTVDNTSWICMCVYTIDNIFRQPLLLSVSKMEPSENAKNIYELFKKI